MTCFVLRATIQPCTIHVDAFCTVLSIFGMSRTATSDRFNSGSLNQLPDLARFG